MKYQAAAAIVASTTEFVKPGHPSPFPRDRTRERPAFSKLAALYRVSRRGEISFSHEGQQRGDENLVLTGFPTKPSYAEVFKRYGQLERLAVTLGWRFVNWGSAET